MGCQPAEFALVEDTHANVATKTQSMKPVCMMLIHQPENINKNKMASQWNKSFTEETLTVWQDKTSKLDATPSKCTPPPLYVNGHDLWPWKPFQQWSLIWCTFVESIIAILSPISIEISRHKIRVPTLLLTKNSRTFPDPDTFFQDSVVAQQC